MSHFVVNGRIPRTEDSRKRDSAFFLVHNDPRGIAWRVAAERAHSIPMRVKLTTGEIEELKRHVDRSTGRGGFQNLMLQVWYYLDEQTGELELNDVLLERIYRYAFRYSNASWRRTLRKLFRRTLGANLDRGFILH